MEFPGKLSNALHLQQQTLFGGEWRSLSEQPKMMSRASNLDASSKYHWPIGLITTCATVPWKMLLELLPSFQPWDLTATWTPCHLPPRPAYNMAWKVK